MLKKSLNIAKNSLKRKNLSVMVGKVLVRFQEGDAGKIKDEVLAWCRENAISCDAFLMSLDEKLWNETQSICKSLEEEARVKLSAIDIDLGGGGNYPLLYFLVRYIQAKNVVETGVAAGWSSQALLTALKDNQNEGRLYSSDFPYFRQDNPEELVGYIVDEELKANWTLLIDGDQNNLPKIAGALGEERVDIFHYDSDKSYKGRVFASDMIIPKCHADSIVIFDDIQDNAHFKDYVEQNDSAFKVFEFEGKYIGLIAKFLA